MMQTFDTLYPMYRFVVEMLCRVDKLRVGMCFQKKILLVLLDRIKG